MDQGLDLIVSVEVEWVSGEGSISLLNLERLDNESDLNTGVRGEDGSRVDLGNLHGPFLKDEGLGFQVGNVDVRELIFEFINCFFGEVAWNVEIVIGDKEMWEGLLDEASDLLLWDVLLNVGEVSTLKDVSVELFECGSHFCYEIFWFKLIKIYRNPKIIIKLILQKIKRFDWTISREIE